MLIDTHAHLSDGAFDDIRGEVIEKARQCSVAKIITSGSDYKSSLEAFSLAQKYEDIYCSIGIYPESILELNDEVESELYKLGQDKKVVAIGEIGLQYTEGAPDRELQKSGFIRQMKLAFKLNKPIVIHCRDAYGDLIDLLKENREYFSGGTLHCYGGSYEIAMEAIRLGYYISVGGVSTFKNAQNIKEVIKKLPLERFVLETDCPYLTPHPFRGKLNMPSYIPTIAENLAELKGVTVEEVAKQSTINARRLFNI